MMDRLSKLGLNYAWGLLNYTLGVATGGAYVAVVLIEHGMVR
jgi:hypothetical protein